MRCAWFIFCVFVVSVWIRVYFDESLKEKTCYIEELPDGQFKMLNTINEETLKQSNVTNVSERFEYLSVSYLAQGVVCLICVSYQLTAIFFVNSLLAYRHYISRINKVALLYGGYILFMTHVYRLDEAGKICSGDLLSDAEKADPSIAAMYLVRTGTLFWSYMMGIWIISIAAVFFGSIIGVQVYSTFS